MPHPPRPDRHSDPAAPAEERTYALFMHLVGILSLVSAPFPLLGPIATVAMWRIKMTQSPFLDDHGRDAVNFQISLLIYSVALTLLIIPTIGLSSLGYLVVAAVTVIGCVRGAIAANRGEFYRYPVTIRFIKDDNGSPGSARRG